MDKANAKPILFNTEMVRAILDRRKTVTRRVIKTQYPIYDGLIIDTTGRHAIGKIKFSDGKCEGNNDYFKPPYQIGDVLYVRETWANIQGKYFYRADMENPTCHYKTQWRPSIHMPKEAARIFLKVTDVRVERLQDILCSGMQKEGCIPKTVTGGQWQQWQKDYFKPLWDSTIKKSETEKYGWQANPWVWVFEFERRC